MGTKGGRWGGGVNEEAGGKRDTLLQIKQKTNKDLLYSTDNPAQCHVVAWMGGGLAAEWIRAAESLRCSLETATKLLGGGVY